MLLIVEIGEKGKKYKSAPADIHKSLFYANNFSSVCMKYKRGFTVSYIQKRNSLHKKITLSREIKIQNMKNVC